MIKSEHKVVQVYNNFVLAGHKRGQNRGFPETAPKRVLFVVREGAVILVKSNG